MWLGASDVGYAGKDFHWADGPEAGQPVGSYAPWTSGNPSNSGGIEQFLEMYADGSWNDIDERSFNYVTEFDGIPLCDNE